MKAISTIFRLMLRASSGRRFRDKRLAFYLAAIGVMGDYRNGLKDKFIKCIDQCSSQEYLNLSLRLKKKIYNYCWRMWSSTVITWDGNISPCCFDKDNKYPFGNINNTTFKEIWSGTQANEFRNNVLIARNGIDICNNCIE